VDDYEKLDSAAGFERRCVGRRGGRRRPPLHNLAGETFVA